MLPIVRELNEPADPFAKGIDKRYARHVTMNIGPKDALHERR
jgi:hypothetical protein